MSKPASWTTTHINIILKSILLIVGGIFISNQSNLDISLFGIMLFFIGLAKILMLLLLFLVFEIINPHNKKNIIIMCDSIVMIFSGLYFVHENPYRYAHGSGAFYYLIVGNNFGLLLKVFIGIGVGQLIALFKLYLWSNLIDLLHKKHLVIFLEPIVLMLCRTFIDDFLVLTLMLRIIGGAQLIAMIFCHF